MRQSVFDSIYRRICEDPANVEMKEKGYLPVYTANPRAKIVIVGQAPGRIAQTTMKPWNDASGKLLRQWLGVSEETFYNPEIISLIPMDFYYPGKGIHGDLPPRKGFAEKWHPELLKHMPGVELIILVGAYAQKYYLGKDVGWNLTETVLSYQLYMPRFFPVVHPSPLNFRWHTRNPWFSEDVVPVLRGRVDEILSKKRSSSI